MATNLDPIDRIAQVFAEAFATPKESIAIAPYEADIKWLIEQATAHALIQSSGERPAISEVRVTPEATGV